MIVLQLAVIGALYVGLGFLWLLSLFIKHWPVVLMVGLLAIFERVL